ncbi:hypothetical protein CGRA01v4_01984 [Colletotrichum graminicola]|nr:hypothetical protein CGRA01v4_01984 [Colletotrichum graminicola]
MASRQAETILPAADTKNVAARNIGHKGEACMLLHARLGGQDCLPSPCSYRCLKTATHHGTVSAHSPRYVGSIENIQFS